jgi:hypothetical protein
MDGVDDELALDPETVAKLPPRKAKPNGARPSKRTLGKPHRWGDREMTQRERDFIYALESEAER